ncbi:Gamma-secretase-activating protein [Microtus ochrogaster]|uniref:Gamma-secretase-activating protein n=1 Tax=Microtus ochrogaster TaxID=79684 RepID=A0A8J6GPZ2_MICOH|nr:Gamma-secretase-activating protein [Microtus ochrogaster]
MALRLITHFDVRADVLPSLRAQAAAAAEGGGAGALETAYESLRVLNIERNGNIIYTYKSAILSPLLRSANSVQASGELLAAVYQFPGNSGPSASEVIHFPEFTVAAHMLSLFTKTYLCIYLLWSKCLTLLVEIHPVNHEKVLKAVDSCIWVQVYSLTGYWAKLNANLEYVKYTKPHLHYHNSVVRREWHNLISEEKTGQRRSTVYVKNILDNAARVISNMESRALEPRLIPLLQEEDRHQRLLVGLMVSELRDHLLRHLQGVERKKIEQIVLDYVSKQLNLIWCMLETSWRKHSARPWVLHLNNHGSAAHFEVFHLMTRILDATSSLCIPLPPGFHSLHTLLGVHCLPLYNLLHYIDNGVLLLTETAVTRLMKDLDNSEKNEQLKFSIIVRLPLCTGQKVFRLWDHPMSSNIISRNHVAQMLRSYKKEPRNSMIGKSSFSTEFLPLNYFVDILAGLESSHQGSSLFRLT